MIQRGTQQTARRGRLILLRHGQTLWSESGQYTGRTDIPLTDVGEEQAADAGKRLSDFGINVTSHSIFVSPLSRAQDTAQLAGFSEFTTEDNLAEFDYGPAEGRTRFEIADALGIDSWNIWDIGPLELPESLEGVRTENLGNGREVTVRAGRGESSDDAAGRVRRVIENALPLLESGQDVLCIAHAHILRILTTQWLGLQPDEARYFRLDTAHFCVLDWHHSDRVVAYWNL